MYVTITKLKLKTPFHFFSLSLHALKVKKQLKKSPCVRAKFSGIGTTHYTMSLWRSKEDLEAFSKSGAHLNSMKNASKIASEVRVLTIDSMNLMPWKEAKSLIAKSRVIKY